MENETPMNYFDKENFAAGGTHHEGEKIPPKIEKDAVTDYMKENPEVTHNQAIAALQLEEIEGSTHDAFVTKEGVTEPLPEKRPDEYTSGQLGDLEEAERDDWDIQDGGY